MTLPKPFTESRPLDLLGADEAVCEGFDFDGHYRSTPVESQFDGPGEFRSVKIELAGEEPDIINTDFRTSFNRHDY